MYVCMYVCMCVYIQYTLYDIRYDTKAPSVYRTATDKSLIVAAATQEVSL